MARFKVYKKGDWWYCSGGKIAGQYHNAMGFMRKASAKQVADARNRLVTKKASITRRVRAARKAA